MTTQNRADNLTTEKLSQESSAIKSFGQQQAHARKQNALFAALFFGAGLGVAVFAIWLFTRVSPPPEAITAQTVDEIANEVLASATPSPAHSAVVYEIILPSLVYIHTSDALPTTDSLAQNESDIVGSSSRAVRYQPEDEGPDSAPDEQEKSLGTGSGVVVNNSGAILTALHVVADAAIIGITFADGTETEATLIAAEPDNDIAVLQADRLPETFAPATLGNPGALRVGDEVYAVGNPLGLVGSLSAGVISGLNRTYAPEDGGFQLQRLIQFDAAVNPGNSGGPLLNRNGEVVGIVVALVNPTPLETFIGIGMAVRIDIAGGTAGLPPQ